MKVKTWTKPEGSFLVDATLALTHLHSSTPAHTRTHAHSWAGQGEQFYLMKLFDLITRTFNQTPKNSICDQASVKNVSGVESNPRPPSPEILGARLHFTRSEKTRGPFRHKQVNEENRVLCDLHRHRATFHLGRKFSRSGKVFRKNVSVFRLFFLGSVLSRKSRDCSFRANCCRKTQMRVF